ncbi:hypothetical protein HDU91_005589 [Kappamyces sp. JEL0680]|nr:hypothetical protein HDU91_005589 [Kappamyces sp. JEL0680]
MPSETTIAITTEKDVSLEKSRFASPFAFTWKDVGYAVTLPDKSSKTLLYDMNGSITSGQVCAVMGGSGAGKSTLLSVLSGRVGAGTLEGHITLGGQPRNPKTWMRDYAFVEQDDLLHPQLTVQETLMFAAQFRMAQSTSLATKQARVDEIIMDLGLNGCRNTVIGGDGVRGISGGERKRVSIAIELMTFPKLLILDEPTSGLDSFTAFNTIKMVKEMAVKRNMVVIATLHQPRTDILDQLDTILLLSAGKTLFFGPTASALDHFASLGHVLPPKVNPSDFFLDLISLDQRSSDLFEKSKSRIDEFHNAWQVRRKSLELHTTEHIQTDQLTKTTNGGFWTDFSVLLKRNWLITIRDRPSWIAAFASSLFVSLLMGFLFWQSSTDSKGTQNKVGALFFVAINTTFSNVIPQLAKFDFEKQIVKRERSSNSYSAPSAFLSKWVATLPVTIVSSILFGVFLYWMVGFQNSATKYLIYLAIIVIHACIASALGVLIAAFVPNLTTGQVLAPTIVTVFLLYGGPLVSLDLIPQALRWIRYLSIISQTTGALLQNEFTDAVLSCPPTNPVCYPTGQAVLEQFSLQSPSMWVDIGINCALLVSFLVLGTILFDRKTKPMLRLQ